MSASAVVIHYEEALYQVYAPLPLLISDITSLKSTFYHSANCYYFHKGGVFAVVCYDDNSKSFG